MTHYVMGLFFSPDFKEVALLHKRRGPPNVIGRWNGPGGRIEPGETPAEAMVREFREETAVETKPTLWTHAIQLVGRDYDMAVLFAVGDPRVARDGTDEAVAVATVANLHEYDVVQNLRWMIPLVLDANLEFAEPLVVYETGGRSQPAPAEAGNA